jgi:hypothetical protein
VALCHDASLTPKKKLGATIHQQKFVDLNLNNSVRAAVIDIKDDKFWKCIYLLLHAVFPALRLLDKPPPSEDESKAKDADTPFEMEMTPYNLVTAFEHQVIWHWNKRKKCIEHEYAIAGWALCVMKDVCKDVREQLTWECTMICLRWQSIDSMCHRLLTLTLLLLLCLCTQ